MKTGRPPKLSVVSTGKIGKEKKLRREIAESKLKVGRNLIAPDWLDKSAQEEFNRIVEESSKLDIIDNMDLGFLAIYCDAYSQYVKICEEIQNTNIVEHEEVSRIRIDLVKMLEKYRNTIMQCSSKLGLATSDRLRLVIPSVEEKKENRYLKYL